MRSFLTAFLTVVALAVPAGAQTLERIKETKQLNLGYRLDAAPMSYQLESGEPAGYTPLVCVRVAQEIVNHLKTGSAFYTPGLAAIEMAEAVINDSKRVMACAAYLDGQFGVSGYFLGVPVVLGENGIERIVEFELTEEERQDLQKSVEVVAKQMEATGL